MTDKHRPAALEVGKRIAGGRGLSAVLLRRASEVELDRASRQERRLRATDSLGRALDVSLPEGTLLRGGDVLVCGDGSLVRVRAAPQPVLVVTPCPEHGDALDLLRAAYHLGQRQVPLELQPDRLLLEPDAALADALRGQHLIVAEARAAFEPEGDAFGAQPGHAHDHGHGHGHGHDHGHDHGATHGHGHGPAHPAPKPASKSIGIPVVGQAAPHVHGPGCGHGHDHDHHHGDGHSHGRGHEKHGH